MQTLSSASRTGSELASALEWATTVRIPISRHVRRMRSAISPRLAMRIFPNMATLPSAAAGHGLEPGLQLVGAESEGLTQRRLDGHAFPEPAEKVPQPAQAAALAPAA